MNGNHDDGGCAAGSTSEKGVMKEMRTNEVQRKQLNKV